MNNLDVLAIVAHPDDAELSCGGTLLLHALRGDRVGVVDLTRGEMGTRGDSELREKEAKKASKILHLLLREHLDFPDAFIMDTRDNRLRVVEVIRSYRPRIIITNALKDRHPDHSIVAQLVTHAVFLSGLHKLCTNKGGKAQAAFRPQALYYVMPLYYDEPDFIVDISSVWAEKVKALQAFSSQFYQKGQAGQGGLPSPLISTEDFWHFIEARARTLGLRIGAKYGEGFRVPRTLGVKDLDALQ